MTYGPGLIGSLLVGVAEAKALSLAWGVPLIGVNHLEAHLFASLLEQPDLGWPLVVLLVSGGHTLLIEDHRARPLPPARRHHRRRCRRGLRQGGPLPRPRLSGRAGHRSDRRGGEADAFAFPRSYPGEGYDLSFSGLKTSVVTMVRKHPECSTADVAASFRRAVVDVLVTRAMAAAADVGATGVCLAGGVAANSLLRRRTEEACAEAGIGAFLPSRALCTDNAAMVAAAGWWRLAHGEASDLSLGADPTLRLASAP